MASEPKKTSNDKTEDKTAEIKKPEDAPQLDPYPTGKGKDPEDDFEAAHGFRREKAEKKDK